MRQSVIKLPFFWAVMVSALLSACDTEKMQETRNSIQQNHFLQSLELVENAGSILQNPQLTQEDIQKAMSQMDEGLKQAFQVEQDFLQKLDARLPKLYKDIFIKGVEHYRLGVESSDRDSQIQGLDLLSQWGQFWIVEKPNIQQKLYRING